jgi:glycine cleavage system regulatory protein
MLNYILETVATVGALYPPTDFVNKILQTLQDKGAKIIDIRLQYINEHVGLVVMIIYEADKPIEL